MVCGHVYLGLRSRLTDPLFVGGLHNLVATWVAFVKQLREEVAVPILVEDQITLGRCGTGVCFMDFEEREVEPSALEISMNFRSEFSSM